MLLSTREFYYNHIMALPRDYDPDAALLACVEEHTVMGTSYESQTRNTLEQAAPLAAQTIVNIAMYSVNEKLRLEAARYIVDRNLGRIGDERMDSAKSSPLEELLGDVVREAEHLIAKS